MSDKTERQQIFGTDDEEDEYPMSQDDSSKLGGSAPRRESRVRITNQQKMQAVAHFFVLMTQWTTYMLYAGS